MKKEKVKIMKKWKKLFFLLLLFVSSGGFHGALSEVSGDDYISPKEAGFRNCALIYYNKNYNAEAIKPILVKYVDGKPTDQAGYDAVLFLLFTVNEKMTLTDQTNMADWQEQLDIYFHREINVPALSKACAELRSQGLLKERIKVIISIPWPHPEMRDFGDVDHDGQSEDLGKSADVDKVLTWYIRQTAQEMKKYPDLDFWGFYMMNEGLAEKYHDLARQFCRNIHEQGYRAFWIPYYNAPGALEAYDLGFDVSVMQSNWTFNTRPDGSGTRRNRLINTADWAKKHHQGIELEINPPEEPYWQDIYVRTLETGTKTGFQKGASATYFGSDFYWPFSSKKESQDLYSLWMDYLAGKPIELPEVGTWTERVKEGGVTEILYHFKKPEQVRLTDLFYEDIPGDFFSAQISVEGQTKGSKEWIPLGWKIGRITKDPVYPVACMTISFMPMEVEQLRITVKPTHETRPGRLTGVEPELKSDRLMITKSFQKSYVTSKQKGTPTYPDESGRDLLDGVTGGDWNKYVGWSMGCSAEVRFDFGEVIEYDEIRLYLLEDKRAAIAWPTEIEMISSLKTGIQANKGYGMVPEGFQFECDFRGDPKKGGSTLKLNVPQKARAMTLQFKRRGWLFLSEVEFYLKGKRLNSDKFSYWISLLDRVSREKNLKYLDDGFMLTDGHPSSLFTKGNVGVRGGVPLIATVDLDAITSINRVTCYVLDGETAGVRVPEKGVVRLSEDGRTWSAPLAFDMPVTRKLRSNETIPVSLEIKKKARFVQVEFSSGSWTFLSEILVE